MLRHSKTFIHRPDAKGVQDLYLESYYMTDVEQGTTYLSRIRGAEV